MAARVHGEVAGKTIGIVGFGRIGKAIAVRARAFGMRVLAVNRSGAPAAEADRVERFDWLEGLLAESDYVVLACPLTDETRGMIGAAAFRSMKPSAMLINVARGPVVDEDALHEAMASRRIAAALLDAWYTYPTLGRAKPEAITLRLRQVRQCARHAAHVRLDGGADGAPLQSDGRQPATLLQGRAPAQRRLAGRARGVNSAKIVTAASSATAPDETRGSVLVSGSYGGVYNAWHALRRGARAVILNDAGVGKNGAGISGLAWLDALGVAGAATDCWTCHIGDGEHMLAHGRISHVNEPRQHLAAASGRAPPTAPSA